VICQLLLVIWGLHMRLESSEPHNARSSHAPPMLVDKERAIRLGEWPDGRQSSRSSTASLGRHSLTPFGVQTIGRLTSTGCSSIAARMDSLLTLGLSKPSSSAGDADLGSLLDDDDAPSAEFMKVLSVLIAKRQIAYRFGGPLPPIWQHEFMQAFDQADATEDWEKIAAMWPRIAPAVEQGLLYPEMVRCLARFGFPQLVEAVDGIKQGWLAFEVANALPVGHPPFSGDSKFIGTLALLLCVCNRITLER